jgi:hypothetical protein
MAPAIDGEFEPETQVVLYTHPVPGDDPSGAPGSTLWTFGLPYGESLSDGQVIVVYYAGTEAAMDIHWARLDVND